MSQLVAIITASDKELRNRNLDDFCSAASLETLRAECDALDRFRRQSTNLYERVRALFFLYAIYRFHLPAQLVPKPPVLIPHKGHGHLLKRRFEEAIDVFRDTEAAHGPSASISSALASAYHRLGFQTLADQVRRSVRGVRGNQWMFRTGHPADYPLRIRKELLGRADNGLFPILRESTPVRMDLTHSGWSDIFFLGMDYPEGAQVLNISIDLCNRSVSGSTPKPPVEAYFRVIDQPVIRLVSVDLKAAVEVNSIAEMFDFARDYLGLLKAAVIAAGIVPPGMEGATQPLEQLLRRLTGLPGHGIEIASKVNEIPKGSRLAVSTNLLASLISACMRATGQIEALTGGLREQERRLVAARAILGEWLGGSGGGWQDSGGVWPGIKLIQGVSAVEGDPEFGISKGCLLPRHHILSDEDVTPQTRQLLQDSLVLVHGGMAQDVGPVLEMVTEKYLLRSSQEWTARQQAVAMMERMLQQLRAGDIRGVGAATQANFDGPIQTIIPWAANLYTDSLIRAARQAMGDDFWGFWMLGGMAGGGMGFLFHPKRKAEAQLRMQQIMSAEKKRLEFAVPFAMEPVVYDFAINDKGSVACLLLDGDALMPVEYYTLMVPAILRCELRLLPAARRAELDQFSNACRNVPAFAAMPRNLFDHLLPRSAANQSAASQTLEALLEKYGFDAEQHAYIQSELKHGRIGSSQNRLPATTEIRDVEPDDVIAASHGLDKRHWELGRQALAEGSVAVVTLAGGAGSRWTRGAGVVKALAPFARLGGQHRGFLEVHLAKSERTARESGTHPLHVVTTSFMTHDAIESFCQANGTFGYQGQMFLSPGKYVGLRLIPTERELRFAWEETAQQQLDQQAQKVRDSLRSTLIAWARQGGEGADYTDNLPLQCLHPVGHWYEIPNLMRNGVLKQILDQRPNLRHLFLHNIDTAGANLDAGLLGLHMAQGKAQTVEVIARHIEDRGGGVARVDGRLRLIEGMALPDEECESRLSYYNTATSWIDIDKMLAAFGLVRSDLANEAKVARRVRSLAARMPAYITLKDVKKRWGKGQEDIFPLAQFERLWGDMTALPEYPCTYVEVSRQRGQQLKEPAQLDGWLRDGSAAFVETLCEWN